MAQVSLSDEQYQTLTTLAQAQGLTPEQFLATVIEQMEIAAERAEYGDAFIEELRQQAAASKNSTVFYYSTEAFLQSVHNTPYQN
jgi:hypothetical protein